MVGSKDSRGKIFISMRTLYDVAAMRWAAGLSQPFGLIDARGHLVDGNPAFAALWEASGTHLPADGLQPSRQADATLAQRWTQALALEEAFQLPLHVPMATAPISVEASPLAPGQVATAHEPLYVLSCPDIEQAERQQRQETILAAAERMVNIGAWEADLMRGDLWWSPHTYDIYQLPPDQPLTMEAIMVCYAPPSQVKLQQAIDGALQRGESYDLELALNLCTPAGEQRYVRAIGEPTIVNGQVVKVCGIVQDITAHKQTEATLRQQADLLNQTQRIAQLGGWELDLATGKTVWTEEVYRIHEVGLDFQHDKDNGIDFYHPKDRPKLIAAIANSVEQQADFDFDCRFITAKGRHLWVRVIGAPVVEHGQVVRIRGLFQDITAQKEAQQALRTSEARMRQLTDNMNEAFWIRSADNHQIEYVNPAYETVWGMSCERLYQEPNSFFEIIHPEDMGNIQQAIAQYDERAYYELEHRIMHPDKGVRWVYVRQNAVCNEAGEVLSHIGIASDITERKQAEQELIEAKEQAERASQAKSEFLSTMSHEIRTPLNAVIGMTGLLEETQLDPEQRFFLRTIRQGGETLLSVINDILDYSKIESGQMELEISSFDLLDPVEDTLELLADKAHRKRLELLYHAIEPLPQRVKGDITRLRQVLVNLVGNALKFTEQGEIVVSVRKLPVSRADGRLTLEFAVRDTGEGIPTDKMHRLFRSFSQIDASTTRKHGGTGLGLAISQRLVELHGGTIWVESEVGQGSTFTFTILVEEDQEQEACPLDSLAAAKDKQVWLLDDNATNLTIQEAMLRRLGLEIRSFRHVDHLHHHLAVHPAPDLLMLDMHLPGTDGLTVGRAIRRRHPQVPMMLLSSGNLVQTEAQRAVFQAILQKPVRNKDLQRQVLRLLNAHTAAKPALEKVAEGREELDLSAFRILLVEDNRVNQRVAQRMLQKFNAKVEVANNGQEAVDFVKLGPFDLILMDMQMPVMDGLEATRLIRSCTEQVQPLILAMTANAAREDRERCLAIGMDDFLSKPIKLDQLREHLRRWLLPQNASPTESQALRP